MSDEQKMAGELIERELDQTILALREELRKWQDITGQLQAALDRVEELERRPPPRTDMVF